MPGDEDPVRAGGPPPDALLGIPRGQFPDPHADLDIDTLAGRDGHPFEPHQTGRRVGIREVRIDLHHLGAVAPAAVANRGANAQHVVDQVDLDVGQLEGRVRQPVAEGERRRSAVAGEVPPAVPAVVAERRGIAAEGREVPFVARHRQRQAS